MKNLNYEIQVTLQRSFRKLSNLDRKAKEIETKIKSLQSELEKVSSAVDHQQQVINNIGCKPETGIPEPKLQANITYNRELNENKQRYLEELQKETPSESDLFLSIFNQVPESPKGNSEELPEIGKF